MSDVRLDEKRASRTNARLALQFEVQLVDLR
jgi:hypothetical protein